MFFFLLLMFSYQEIGWWGRGWWFWEYMWQQCWKNAEVYWRYWLVEERCWGLQWVQEARNWLVEDAAALKSRSQWRPIYKKICNLASVGCLQLQVNIVSGQFWKVLLQLNAFSWRKAFYFKQLPYGFPPSENCLLLHTFTECETILGMWYAWCCGVFWMSVV